MNGLAQDLRYAIRGLRRSPGFTAVAVLTLAIGIGANTAMFSVVDTVVFRPLPYKNSDRLVKIWGVSPAQGRGDLSIPELIDVRDQNGVFEEVAADDGTNYKVTHQDGRQDFVDVALVTANWLPTLGVQPLVGRNFLTAEERSGGDRVLILGNDYWRNRFNADPNVIGKTLILDGESFSVIGVLPPNVLRYASDLLKPLVSTNDSMQRGNRDLDVFARLKPNVTLARAEADMEIIAGRLALHYPVTNKGRGITLEPLGKYYTGTQRQSDRALVLMFGAVGLVLLIACANVANLLLTRAVTRRREYVMRATLGASRSRLIRESLTESVVLFLVGGMAGVLLARLSVDLLIALAITGGYMPSRMTVTLDSRVLFFSLLVSLSTALLFGLTPALQASTMNLTEALNESGRALSGGRLRSRTKRVLIVSELALALLLLVGFGLVSRSFMHLQGVSLGFDPENTVTILGATDGSFTEQVASWRSVMDRVRALPDTESVALTSRPPLRNVRAIGVVAEHGSSGRESERLKVGDVFVSSDYFRTIRVPVVKGRSFTDQDSLGARPVAIISQSLARRIFAAQEPLGQQLNIDTSPRLCCAGSVQGGWLEVVGVVGDVRQRDLDEEPAMTLYRPYSQIIEHDMFVVARARSSVATNRMVASLPSDLTAVTGKINWFAADRMEDVVSGVQSLTLRRFALVLLGLFASLATIMAAVGLYGVTAYAVAERTREIGIRMALGATSCLVVKQVLAETMALALAGVILGGLGAQVLTRFISMMLFGVSSADAVTYLAVSLLLVMTALIAAYLPARRATRVDPLVALRYE